MQTQTFPLVFSSICIAINLVLGTLVQTLKIPLIFLDTLGTILGAVMFGPFFGGAIGLLTNIIQGMLTNPKDIPFAIVNLAIGVIVGYVARRYTFSWLTALLTGLLIAVVAPLIGTPIAIWVYGGLTGGGTDLIFLWLLKSGQKIFTAAFIPRITGNLIDKIACALLVASLVRYFPANILRKATNPLVSSQGKNYVPTK
ncbi:CD3073 family putative ECF transporter S component [Sporomusa sp.]|jgi:energy-coupling factor transport system substrate-specific component|uniref:CD3073 family putative ECF transporter S component n=1 Tax=Sporomusa sp. TaxID=2078658 RepID=UPI002C9375F8|nr:CD3073 family putative ECF transporter S component [Sporomusa sp.]HWR08357.1 ECF transporter S component [Sporomusa sp.]